jgi:CrcB protein
LFIFHDPLSIFNLFLVGVGGMLGSVARYLAQLAALRLGASAFPAGTLAVNVLGSFLIGLVYGWSGKAGDPAPAWRLFLTTGFCGGFTTFSAFSLESITLLRAGNLSYALLYIGVSVLSGLGACLAGLLATR